MKLSEKIALTAESQVGIREQGNNGGPDVVKYQKCTWLPPGEWPWCAAFVDWCISSAMQSLGEKFTFAAPKTAGAWDLENWCHSIDNSAILKKPHNGDIKRGDVIIFCFSHTGIATSDAHPNGTVETVEGNTNSSGGREGDGVYPKVRKLDSIRSRIRFTV
jgi:hypothetical protein